ncbi:Signal recognition particle-docking protein [Candidatus Hepatincolaceae symbiont of Richtersius coronifer]
MFSFFKKNTLDQQLIEDIEEELIKADIGLITTKDIMQKLKKAKLDKEITAKELKEFIQQRLEESLYPFLSEKTISFTVKPFVILISGTNGSGKTTTIAKLTHMFKQQGKKILLAPCDTFRAGATEQLHKWSNALGAHIFQELNIKDPSAIAYKAFGQARAEDFDILIIDTAGRLDNNNSLMDELKKIEATIKKIDPLAPHESILIVDGTVGNTGLPQAQGFAKAISLSGIIITKLDSQAKGGYLVNIIKNLQIPVYYIGIGETREDLIPFNLKDYIKNLLIEY